jgi:hypothetical protein
MRRSVRFPSGTAASRVSPPMLVLQPSGSCRSQTREHVEAFGGST